VYPAPRAVEWNKRSDNKERFWGRVRYEARVIKMGIWALTLAARQSQELARS
jgi:hypothetical protein